MRIGPSLILASRQTLAMTPQLQQAIKLLQFSHLELAAYIQQELEKNPLLQENHTTDDGPGNEPEAPVAAAPVDTADTLAAAAPALAEADDRWTREHADRGGDATATKTGQRDDVPDALDFVAEDPTSQVYQWIFRLAPSSDKLLRGGHHIVVMHTRHGGHLSGQSILAKENPPGAHR